jgi:hypothetical protein
MSRVSTLLSSMRDYEPLTCLSAGISVGNGAASTSLREVGLRI